MQNSERRARRIVQENGKVLRIKANREWLQKLIDDQRSHVYDDNPDAFVRLARDDLPISRVGALSLHRLFQIRSTQAFKDALALY